MTITDEIRERLREEAGRNPELQSRYERLATLLEHYQDVLDGIQDGARSFEGPGDGLALMCEAWNHPAYQQLERLRIVLGSEEPALYWQLAEVYFRAGRKRVAKCPRCGRESIPKPEEFPGASALSYGSCKHGGDHVKLQPVVKRVVSAAVEPLAVVWAIRWLEERWAGGVFVPEDVQAIVERRSPKASRREAARR